MADALRSHAHAKDGQLGPKLPHGLQGDARLVRGACRGRTLTSLPCQPMQHWQMVATCMGQRHPVLAGSRLTHLGPVR